MATADGVMQAMKQGSFGAQHMAAQSATEALFWLMGKRADVPTSGNDAPGAQPAGGNSGQNAQAGNRPGKGVLGMGNAPAAGKAPAMAVPSG